MFALVLSAFLFIKKPPTKHYTREEMFDEVTASLAKYGDNDAPAGYEKVAEMLIDANFDGIYEAYREYTNGEKYWVNLYFTDTKFRITPASYKLIDNPATQECLLASATEACFPMVFIKETGENSVTYKNLELTETGKNVVLSFGEKTQDGAKTYYINNAPVSKDEYDSFVANYTFGHFNEADDNLLPDSFRMIWQKK